MKAFIRKTAAWLFLMLGISPLLIAVTLTCREIIIQNRMKRMLESRELQTVVIAENAVIWMDDHEIWVNESMFDISSKKLENGVYTFTGLYDEDETEVVKQQHKQQHQQTREEKALASSLWVLTRFYAEEIQCNGPHTVNLPELNSFYLLKHTQFFPAIIAPPPKPAATTI